jgi:hypothetical protein
MRNPIADTSCLTDGGWLLERYIRSRPIRRVASKCGRQPRITRCKSVDVRFSQGLLAASSRYLSMGCQATGLVVADRRFGPSDADKLLAGPLTDSLRQSHIDALKGHGRFPWSSPRCNTSLMADLPPTANLRMASGTAANVA